MKWIALVVVGLLVGCGYLSPEQAQSATEAINALYEAGKITLEQRDAAIQLVMDQSGFDWGRLVDGAITLGLGYFGIRAWRGTPENRRGATS